MGVLLIGPEGACREALAERLPAVPLDAAQLSENPSYELAAAARTLASLDGIIFLALPEAGEFSLLLRRFAGAVDWFAAEFVGPRRPGALLYIVREPPPAESSPGGHQELNASVLALVRSEALRLGAGRVRVNMLVLADPAALPGSPLRRTYTDQELAGLVRFLVGPEASYMSGGVVRMDGGAGAGVSGYEAASG
jgi:hypothetical protein